MEDAASLQRLLTWLSPAFPVGGFAWSAGLETMIAERRITEAATLTDWIAGALRHGSLRADAILLAAAHRIHADPQQLQEIADLCFALTAAAERHLETALTGDAFASAARAWPSEIYARLPAPCPYPVAVGAIAAAHAIALEPTLLAYLTAAAHAQVSVAVRLVPLGQTAGLAVLAALEPAIAALAATALTSGLADLGGIAYAADIAQMRHETLSVRVFRS